MGIFSSRKKARAIRHGTREVEDSRLRTAVVLAQTAQLVTDIRGSLRELDEIMQRLTPQEESQR